jgi:hypothetical protein
MRTVGGFFLLWIMHAVLGTALAAPILFLGRKRAGFARWQLLALIIPFCFWAALILSRFSAGRRNLTSLAEPFVISLAIPVLAILRIAIGRKVSEMLYFTISVTFLSALVLTAFLVVPLRGLLVGRGLTKFDRRVIDAHEQRYMMSCIPSSVEMVLKLTGHVPRSYYQLQNAWKNKSDGSFHDFDGKKFEGLTFHQKFCMARDSAFPLTNLFETIDRELQAGRFVIVGLAAGNDFHNWVIYDESLDGEFLAVSKFGKWTIQQAHVKRAVIQMHGTDIGTYDLTR